MKYTKAMENRPRTATIEIDKYASGQLFDVIQIVGSRGW
jgi:hypothetical protein